MKNKKNRRHFADHPATLDPFAIEFQHCKSARIHTPNEFSADLKRFISASILK